MNKKKLIEMVTKILNEGTAIYKNKITGKTYRLSGIRDLDHAWSVYKTVCKRTGWNPETFQDDVIVKMQ